MNPITTNTMDDLNKLEPYKRFKYIRKVLLKISQEEFCSDGIIGLSTLKHIERGVYEIKSSMNDILINKLLRHGIICSKDFFLTSSKNLSLEINHDIFNHKAITDINLKKFNDRIPQLIPIAIKNDEFSPHIPQGSIIFINPFEIKNPDNLHNTLCFIEGKSYEKKIFYITNKNNEIMAEYNGAKTVIPKEVFELFKIHVIENIFFENNQ